MGQTQSEPRPGFFGAIRLIVHLCLAGCLTGSPTAQRAHAADDPFELQGRERVVFFGDSITQSGGFVADIEAYFLTRFPDRTITVLNHGRSSETISGTSEEDHHPRRPDAHTRLARDVAGWKPDIVVACFGMEAGLDVTGLERFPTVALARAVRARVVKRREAIDAEWRRRVDRDPSYQSDPASAEYRGDDGNLAEIRRLCRPRDVRVQLVPAA